MRLDKYLADMNCGTRSALKQAVKNGVVIVNGKNVKDSGMQVKPGVDEITYQGITIVYHEFEYIMLNKPAGVVSATEDKIHKTVVALCCTRPGIRGDLAPAGRLDLDTEGLLLMTNDGALMHRLLAPGKHVEKEYYVETLRPVSKAAIDAFSKGIDVVESDKGADGFRAKPAYYSIIEEDERNNLYSGTITITEGKYHQIKRMFQSTGNEVTYLRRIRMGNLRLDESLEVGAFRNLTSEELEDILR